MKMFRYLEKYTGKYRVLGYLDLDTNDFPRDENGNIDPSYDDLYIPCSRGKSVIKHTYDNDILMICFYDKASTAKNVFEELKNKYKNLNITLEIIGIDGIIYFHADDIKKIATVVKPKTSGASIKWNSTRNLPKVSYEVPEECIKDFNKITKNLTKVQKMQFGRQISSAFLEKNKLKDDQKNSRLSAKEFIHSKGLWDDYLKFAKKEVKNYD